jgi:hypothetical protein
VRGKRLGATTGPLDGRALTHGVDARASEGAGSSAATLHGAVVSRLDLAKAFFVELRERLAGVRGTGRGSSSWSRTGQRSSPPPPARAPTAGKKTRRRRCISGLRRRKEGVATVFVPGRRHSPPPARPPAAGKKQAAAAGSAAELRVGEEK